MSTKRNLRSLVALALLAGLINISPTPASALTFNERPATQWANYYAGKGVPTPVVKSSSVWKNDSGAPSNFIVNYTNFPDAAKVAFDAAVSIWAARYPSSVPITISATWAGDLGPGVLGAARPGGFFAGFAGAPDPTLWYPSALANALAGTDLDPTSEEIVARFSSTNPWYLGTDGKTPAGRYDFETAVLHELCHGLGFLSDDQYDATSGMGALSQPTPFDAFVRTQDGNRLSDIPNPSRTLGTYLTSSLTWSGALAVAANNGAQPKLYTPSTYSSGSSVSHLDEATYPSGTPNTLMTPQLEPGEAIHDPGPIATAMLQDMRTKPPTAPVTALPSAPQNVVALVGDRSALVTFDPPVDARLTQVTSYTVSVTPGGNTLSTDSSPFRVTGLQSGTTYQFSISAVNTLGSSPTALSNTVVPQSSWRAGTVDPGANPKFVAATTFRKHLTVVYADSATGTLKRSIRIGKKWTIQTIDGPGVARGSTTNNLNGALSTCVTGSGTKQILNIFYTDTVNKDLLHAAFNGKRWKFDIVDGNGPVVQEVNDPVRVRTASDVSVSNACVSTPAGLQVFYRDDSQGILLGAVQVGSTWRYELVDGDRVTNGRTIGDVGFHLAAAAIGRTVHVLYDSVLKIDPERKATVGDIREAVRSSASPSAWNYISVDSNNAIYPVSGYGLSLNVSGKKVIGAWLSATNSTLGTPVADTIDWATLNSLSPTVRRVASGHFGAPSQPLAVNSNTLLYGCQGRLCSVDLASGRQHLVSDKDATEVQSAAFATVSGKNGVLVGLNHALTFLKP
ncbi:MAG TPA: fibronectin type III domain-containing protein [Candidatus Nanopelagicaceae bacterium]|nr:fibronectin type III domain-containing protein [Candidatus Nanopelagicaceae bacterium]